MPQGEALEVHKQAFSPRCTTVPCLQQGKLILYIVSLFENWGQSWLLYLKTSHFSEWSLKELLNIFLLKTRITS